MEVLRGRVALAVLCAAFVCIEKATGQNIGQSSNQIIQTSNINADNANYNTIQNGFNLGRPTANFIPSVVNVGIPQGGQGFSSVQQANVQQANVQQANVQQANLQQANVQQANLQQANVQQANLQQANVQQANIQQASNNYNPYAGSSSTSSSVSEQSISLASPGIISPGYSNLQAGNIAGISGQQQYQNVNQNSAISQVQTAQNGQSLSTTSNQVAITNQNVLPTYQNLPINQYPFGGNFEIPLNLEVSLPPVSIAVADQLGPVSTQAASLPPQQQYNPNPYGYPYFPIPYSTGGCSGRSGIRDLLPIFLVALCNNNGRCGGGQGGCGNGCNNCIPVPVPIPIPFNPVIVKCGAYNDSNEDEDTGSNPQTKNPPS